MRANVIITALLILNLKLLNGQSSSVHVQGLVFGKDIPDKAAYSNPEIGTCYFGFRDSVTIDSLGNFEIVVDIDEPMLLQIKCGKLPSKFLIIESGKEYKTEFNFLDKENMFKVYAENSEGQHLFNKFDIYPPNTVKTIQKFYDDTLSLEQSFEYIADAKNTELQQLSELLCEKKISRDFYEIAKNERLCYYLIVQASIANNMLELSIENNDHTRLEELKDKLNEIFKSIYNSNYLKTTNYSTFIETFVYYKILENFDFNYENFVQELTKKYQEKDFHTYFINESKKYFEGNILEYFRACYMWIEALQKNYEKEFIVLFENYKKDYPNSSYTTYLDDMIQPIEVFHNKLRLTESENIVFLNNYETINSIQDAVKQLTGQRFFIDVWATWCGPCKAEFRHNEKQMQLLKRYNIEKLYISIDKEYDAEKWKNMIKFYNLKGYHILANENLINELMKLYNPDKDGIAIPFYILVDNEGNVIKKHLPYASELELLENKLKN